MPTRIFTVKEFLLRLGAGCAAAALMGCQSYAPKPVDLPAHRAAWLDRSPAAPGVVEFADALAREGGAAATPFDTGDGIDLREAEAIALFYNAELRIARLKAGVTAATAQYAGLWEDPMLAVDGAKVLESVDKPWKAFGLLSLTLPVSGRLTAEKERAGAEHAAQIARIAEQEWATRIALRVAWVEWSAAVARAAALRDFLVELEQVVAISRALQQAGEMPLPDARLFLVEQSSRRVELRALESASREGELAVRAIMGLAPDSRLTLTPLITLSLPVAEPEPLLPANPMLAVARAEYEVAERAFATEIRKQYPDLTLGGGYGNDEGQDQVLFALSLPIPLINRNQRGIAEADAARMLAGAALETRYESLASQLASSQVRLTTAIAQREQIETELAPLADAQYRDAVRIARLGEVDPLLLLESLMRQVDTKLRLIDSRAQESTSAVRVQEILGPAAATAPERTSP